MQSTVARARSSCCSAAFHCRMRAALTGHGAGLFSAVFSEDGSEVLTASGGETAKIWDSTTGGGKQTLTGHRQVYSLLLDWTSIGLFSAEFSAGGYEAVTAYGEQDCKGQG